MVAAANAMDRTVFVYTSDHGYHSGQWAVPYCKMLPYVEDVRIPFFVRLPPSAGGAGGGRRGAGMLHFNGGLALPIAMPVLNIDLAPTLLDLAGYDASPTAMDGKSFIPILERAAGAAATAAAEPMEEVAGGLPEGAGGGTAAATLAAAAVGGDGRTFLIEYFPIPTSGSDVQVTTRGTDGWCTDPDVVRAVCPSLPVTVDSVNNTWACVRTVRPPEDSLFCHFWDATGYTATFVEERATTTPNFVEYYDLKADPYQLVNGAAGLNATHRAALEGRLGALLQCKGAAGCGSVGA